MEATDKQGRTEAEFLESYDRNRWERPSLTADAVVFSIDNDKPIVLLIKRGGHPFLNCWALPGGFVNEGESAESAAHRELKEETGIEGVYLEQFCFVSTPERDPRGWTVSACYMASVEKSSVTVNAGDDADNAQWFNFDYVRSGSHYEVHLTSGDTVLKAELDVKRDKMGNIDLNATEILSCEGLAFDHVKLLLLAIERL